MSKKEFGKVSTARLIFAGIIAAFDLAILYLFVGDGYGYWLTINIIAITGIILIPNILNFFLARTIYKLIKANPLILIIGSIVVQFAILIIKAINAVIIGLFMGQGSFGDGFIQDFISFQPFFIGAYLGFLSCFLKISINKSNSDTPKDPPAETQVEQNAA